MKRLVIVCALMFSATIAQAQTVRLDRALAPPPTTMQSAVTANANGTAVSSSGYAAMLLDVTCATCSGGTLVNFEYSLDNSTFTAIYAEQVGASTIATTTTATSMWRVATFGVGYVRARVSAYSAGTVTVKAYPAVLAGPANASNVIVSGTVAVTKSGAWDITNAGTFAVQATQTTSPWIVAGGGTAGTAATGVVTVQGIASMTKLLVTPDSVALPANQSVNVSQINGVTPLMGAGNTGTGSPRVTVATDQAAIATWGLGATGAAVPSGGQYTAGNAITALPSAATAGNLTGASYDKFGRQVVLTGTIRDLRACQTTTISASTSETTIITAAGANVFADPYLLMVSNTSASTNTRIDFRDATAGTVLFSLQSIGGAPPAGFSLPQSIPQTTANNNWTAQAATSTTDLRVYACYEKNK